MDKLLNLSKAELNKLKHEEMLNRLRSSENQKAIHFLSQALTNFQAFKFVRAKIEKQVDIDIKGSTELCIPKTEKSQNQNSKNSVQKYLVTVDPKLLKDVETI